jgi:hypothetical protein
VRQHAADELLRHLRRIHRPVVKGGNDGKDHRPRVSGQGHVAQVDLVEGRFTDTENERASLFEAHVGSPFYQIRSQSIGNACKRTHAARQDDHAG